MSGNYKRWFNGIDWSPVPSYIPFILNPETTSETANHQLTPLHSRSICCCIMWPSPCGRGEATARKVSRGGNESVSRQVEGAIKEESVSGDQQLTSRSRSWRALYALKWDTTCSVNVCNGASSSAACSNLLPQLVTTYLSQCLWWHPAATLRAFEKTSNFTVCQAAYLVSSIFTILGESKVWMLLANMWVFSSNTVARRVWTTACGWVDGWVVCTQRSLLCCLWFWIPSPPSPWQAKDQRCCWRDRNWMTTSGTLWRWCDEARACSCLWIMSQWKVSLLVGWEPPSETIGVR